MRDIIIADNQDITRIGLKHLIGYIDSVASVSIVTSKAALIKHLSQYTEALTILDYTLSDFTAVDELLNLAQRFPKSHYLLFSDELSSDFLSRLLFSSEQFSVVLKSASTDEINSALGQSFKNIRFVCSRVSNQLFLNQKQDISHEILTSTEKEILKEIALGKTTKEIAASRILSFHTIITHRKNIFRKLDVNNIHEATKYAIRAGIIDIADYCI